MKLTEITDTPDVNNLKVGKVGGGVCFKYDIEQCAEILEVKQGSYGKEYVVRAFQGRYVNNETGSLITLQPRDCWIDRRAIADRYTKAGKDGIMHEFNALCQEASTKDELIAVFETLDREFHSGAVGIDWVDWHGVNAIIEKHIVRL